MIALRYSLAGAKVNRCGNTRRNGDQDVGEFDGVVCFDVYGVGDFVFVVEESK